MSVSFDGLTPSNLPTNSRTVVDANYQVSRALPASATTVYSSSLDLGDVVSGIPYATTETVNVTITAPALTNGQMSSNTITYTVQDSADNSSFADTILTKAYTGAGSGMSAATITFKLQPGCRRYIRLSVTNSGASDASASTSYLQLAF